MHADGSQDVDLHAPEFDLNENDAQLQFGGLTGTGKLAPNAQSLVLEFSVPSITLDLEGALWSNVTDIRGSLNAVPTNGAALWVGNANLRIAGYSFEPVEGQEAPSLNMEQFRFTSSVDDTEAGVGIQAGYTINRLTVAGEGLNDIVLDFNIGPLDRGALERYIALAFRSRNELAAQNEAVANAAMQEILASAGELLTTGRPGARLEKVGFSYGGGRMDGSGSVQYVGGGDVSTFNPFMDIAASASFTGDKTMVQNLVAEVLAKQQYGNRLESLPEKERNRVLVVAQFQLDTVVKQGMVADAGETYAVEASYSA